MSEVIVACDGLTKQYGTRTVVDDLCLRIDAGTVYGLLGPNGAGKTTTIAMLCGILPPSGGQATVCGRPVHRKSPVVRGYVGYVPQEIALWDGMTARENLTFFGRLYGLRGTLLRQRVDEALEIVDVTGWADHPILHFSGGMRRRINIAVALLHHPRFLALDEPTVGVDPHSRNAILERVCDFAREGTAVLFASHYMEEVQRISTRVGILDHGRLIAEGSVAELTHSIVTEPRAVLSANGDASAALRLAEQLGQIATSRITADERLEITAPDLGHAIARLVEESDHAGLHLTNIEIEQPSLERVFFSLTGKGLRD